MSTCHSLLEILTWTKPREVPAGFLSVLTSLDKGPLRTTLLNMILPAVRQHLYSNFTKSFFYLIRFSTSQLSNCLCCFYDLTSCNRAALLHMGSLPCLEAAQMFSHNPAIWEGACLIQLLLVDDGSAKMAVTLPRKPASASAHLLWGDALPCSSTPWWVCGGSYVVLPPIPSQSWAQPQLWIRWIAPAYAIRRYIWQGNWLGTYDSWSAAREGHVCHWGNIQMQ